MGGLEPPVDPLSAFLPVAARLGPSWLNGRAHRGLPGRRHTGFLEAETSRDARKGHPRKQIVRPSSSPPAPRPPVTAGQAGQGLAFMEVAPGEEQGLTW